MKKNVFQKSMLCLFTALLCIPMTMQAKVEHLLPKVHSLTETKGTPFALQRAVTITDANNTAALKKVFTDYGCTIADGGATVAVQMVESIEGAYDYTLEGYDNEGYQLIVESNAITIKAVKPIGVIRAAQTLAQLAEGYDEGAAAIETVEITDWAAFKLRGYMHDVGRSFISVAELKKHIDLLSRFKVNTFHWHFTENQAWRFEVEGYPQLTSASSMTRFPGDYYTQAQCREVAEYAQERGVIIIPEIDMPGHSAAFKRAMGFSMQTDEGVEVLKTVLTQLAKVFPYSPYIHIGADEEQIEYPDFLAIMADHIHGLGRKMVVWNPIRGVAINSTMCDMTQMWSSSGANINGVPDIDCRYNYTNHFDVFADVVGIYKSNIYYADKGSEEIAGTISAYWNDRKTPTEEDIVKQNNMYANVLASAERAWYGGRVDGNEGYIEKLGTTLPNSGEVYEEFKDWETRFLFHKANSLKDEPIPYVKQTNVRWRITDAFPNGGTTSTVFAPEAYATKGGNELIPETFVHEGKTYHTGIATGAGIYLRHTWGNNIIPTYYGTTNYSNSTAYAWTYVYSEEAQTVGAQIEFQNYGRSEKDPVPSAGEWDLYGSKIWLNGKEIPAPAYKNAGVGIDNEVELQNENFTAREPIAVKLNAGWNKVFLKLPYINAGYRLDKWMFTFVLTDLEGKNAVEGLIYSPDQYLKESTESVMAKVSELKRDRGALIGTAIGQWPESLAADLDAAINEVEATRTADMTDDERAAQVEALDAAWTAFSNSLTFVNMNKPEADKYYRMCTPLRGNRYVTANGVGEAIAGVTAPTESSIWKFEPRNDGSYDIVNYSDGTFISPASNNNAALKTSAARPATGWTLGQAATSGYFIFANGSAQFNQQNNGSYHVLNWGGGSNTTDTGCQYEIVEFTEELPLKALVEVEVPAEATYPYTVDNNLTQKVFARKDITIAVDVTMPATISGRVALVCGSDITQASTNNATKTNSPYIAYGFNEKNQSYLASSRGGDRFSNSGYNFAASTNYKVVYVIDKTNQKLHYYVNRELKTTMNFPSSGYELQSFSNFAGNENAQLNIGSGVVSNSSSYDKFSGTVHTVKFYEGALDASQVKSIFASTLNVVSNVDANATFSWDANNFTTSTIQQGDAVTEPWLRLESCTPSFFFLGFYSDAEYTQPLGSKVKIDALTADRTIYAKFATLADAVNGDQFYIYADTKQSNDTYVARYLYRNSNGSLATSTDINANLNNDAYKWTLTKVGDNYTFANAAGGYLGYGNSGNGLTIHNDTPVELIINTTSAVHAGSYGVQRVRPSGDANGQWMVTAAGGGSFNRNSSAVNNGSWCSDYLFVPVAKGGRTVTINNTSGVEAKVVYNGETYDALPLTITLDANDTQGEITVVPTNSAFTFSGFLKGEENVGTAISVADLTEDATYDVSFSFALTAGKRYYLYAYTQPTSGNYVNRYIYQDASGAVKTSTSLLEQCDNYIWTAVADGDNFKLTNGAGKTLAYNSSKRFYMDETGTSFTINSTNVATKGKVSIYSGVYVVTQANGASFNQYSSNTVNSSGNNGWSSDYMFIPVEEINDKFIINFISNNTLASGTITWNGETKNVPCSFEIAKDGEGNAVLQDNNFVLNGGNGYAATLRAFGANVDTDFSNGLAVNGHATYSVNYTLDIFSANYGEKWVNITRASNDAHAIILPDDAENTIPVFNTFDYATEGILWSFVGTAESFKVYNKRTGDALALTPSDTPANGVTVKMVAAADAQSWHLIEYTDGYTIAPVGNNNFGINSYTGTAGSQIKFYGAGDSGTHWKFTILSQLTMNFTVEGTQPFATNTRISEVAYTCNGVTTNAIIKQGETSKSFFLPAGSTFSITQPWLYRGYLFEGFFNGEEEEAMTFTDYPLAATGLTVNAKYTIDEDNQYQYLYWYRGGEGPNDPPYRIPAITVTKSGKVLAISDYRTCGDDIGMGEVDIMFRSSTESYDEWDGMSWTHEAFVANGQGGNDNVFNVGFGDAAVVSDRESNKTLVMAVAGKQRFNWASSTSHNSMAHIITEDDGKTWTITDVTSQFMANEEALFPTAYSMFFTSGRILQSSNYKAPGADYYRLYSVLVVNDNGDSSYPNYAVYSDDFGTSWKILGGMGNGQCCAGGNETAIEELPNGDLVVSVRRSGGRTFNVFSYGTGENDKANGVGTWNGTANSSFGASDCNGELLRVGNILFQSIPMRGYQGKDRSNVGIYYKVLNPEKDYTSAEIASDWILLKRISNIGSAYSTMTLLPDGKTLGFLYEEDPDNGTFAYNIVYLPIDLTEVLSIAVQKEAFVVNSTIGEYKIGTFYANDAMVVPEGITAYVALQEPTMTDGEGTITMTEVIDGIIPTQTGALICGEPGIYTFKMADTDGTTDVANSLMTGYAGIYEYADVLLPPDGSTNYILAVKEDKIGFYRKSTGFKVYNNKAYLNVPGNAYSLRIRFGKEEDTTEIENSEFTIHNSELIYDLQGRRVLNPTKGMYIVNGRKVVIK